MRKSWLISGFNLVSFVPCWKAAPSTSNVHIVMANPETDKSLRSKLISEPDTVGMWEIKLAQWWAELWLPFAHTPARARARSHTHTYASHTHTHERPHSPPHTYTHTRRTLAYSMHCNRQEGGKILKLEWGKILNWENPGERGGWGWGGGGGGGGGLGVCERGRGDGGVMHVGTDERIYWWTYMHAGIYW